MADLLNANFHFNQYQWYRLTIVWDLVGSNPELKLYVDGRCVVQTAAFDPADYDLTNGQSLLLGFGKHDHFNGKIRDLRIYRRALSDADLSVVRKQLPASR